ncbi:MAG TPA: DUF4870 domain-containing protein [Burkholderiales bacterium]|jgi:uncharacterized membrane protein|nr:DUF4870 domain-containing protein [Burkholderiales bacterium]
MSELSEDKQKDLALLVYVLQIIGFFIGLTWIAGVIINYIKRDEVQGTWVASHFEWQIKTFWVALIGAIIGWVTMFILIGFLILPLVAVWCIYRVVKGLLALNDRKELGTGYF